MTDSGATKIDPLAAFLDEAKASGGSELANYQLFVERLCGHLGLAGPDMAKEENALNDYVFERRVDFKHPDGSKTAGRIDCYKRRCFILEAKQSAKRQTKKHDADQLALLPEDAAQHKSGQAKRGTRTWDKVMAAARNQAESYAKALPVEHGYPPFLMIVDVGHVIEVFADFSGQGKNYAHFPDRQSYRLSMDDLADTDVQDRLRAIWTDPLSLDPARKSAEVTRDIAARLAKIAKRLEGRHDPRDVAEFLMRCLFTMFAEDVDLLPDKGFEKLLWQMKETPQNLVPALESLWQVMDKGGYAPHLNASVKRFNGTLFKSRTALPLDEADIHELAVAAGRDWQDVEPAIFGTLLERALDPRDRSKLGAHYTPRAYVERLVIPTIIEPLRTDWETVQGRVQELHEAGNDKAALQLVKDFHHELCTTRVLDPACGTGNFLYVSLELMKKLEGEVLEALEGLGEDQGRFVMKGETVDPHQFFGLEINPRAVPIADLVLWIGYLKWQLKTGGPDAVTEPVLDAYGTIREQDAILAYDRQDLLRDENGKPLSRWDGVTKKLHPITGEEIPDPDHQVPLYTYANPRPADWPEAEFIVGNPPFIGGGQMREELGKGYAESVWSVRPKIPPKADFVMHFWDAAATLLTRKATAKKPNPLRRFGFITTNSITQTFSRRVIERHMAAKTPLSLVFAVPDHPWLKASDKAAVRIAMTVAEKGDGNGVLGKVASESALDTDTPKVSLTKAEGKLSAKLTVGADVTAILPLNANESISSNGPMLGGAGFLVRNGENFSELNHAGRKYLKPYVKGKDLTSRLVNRHVIDFFGLTESDVLENFPKTYQHLTNLVKPLREQSNRASYRQKWWIFSEPRKQFREISEDLRKFIATTETTKHRFFQYIQSDTIPDHMVVAVGIEASACFSVLSSRVHVAWTLATGGWLGVGNDSRYSKTRTFDPFPFPACVTDDTKSELTKRLEQLGERLDAFRKERLAEHNFLTMTGLYNVLERLRELENGCDVEPLSDKERDIYEAGLIGILKELHDDIDRAVFEAYGWQDLIPQLVGKPGATTPSPHKSDDQEAAEEELLTRLVALNQERAAEEARGHVRWLRPDYQIPKLGHKVKTPKGEQMEADVAVVAIAGKPTWPKDEMEQIRLVREILTKVLAPALPGDISASFDGRNTAARKKRVDKVLKTLVAAGTASADNEDGDARYFMPR